MAEADWDDDNFEPEVPAVASTGDDKWEGEDADDEVKVNWDDDDEDSKEKQIEGGSAIQVKKKKPLKERIAEREAKQKLELEARKKKEIEQRNLSQEEQLAEKLRRQKMQEESDLKLACEAFGVSEPVARLDNFDPVSKEDFESFKDVLKTKITQYEPSPYYVGFLENLYRDLAVSLDPEDVKRLGSALNTLANEKTKAQKGTKAKKKKGPKLMSGKESHKDIDTFDDGTFGGEFDDFI